MTTDEDDSSALPKLQKILKAIGENGDVDDTVRVDEKVLDIPMMMRQISQTEKDNVDPEVPPTWDNCDFETAISATGKLKNQGTDSGTDGSCLENQIQHKN